VICGFVLPPNTGSGWTNIVRNNTAAEIVLTDIWATNGTFLLYLEDAFGVRTKALHVGKFIIRSGLVLKPGEGLVVSNPLLSTSEVWYSGYFQ
jgi:hypothetical protein